MPGNKGNYVKFQSTCVQRNVMDDDSFPDFLSSAAARLDRDRFPRKKKNHALQPLIDRNKTQIKIKIRHSFILNS